MKNLKNLILIFISSIFIISCTTEENEITPETFNNGSVDLTQNEHFDATWNITTGGEISSMAFTSEGLATIQGTASNARTLVEEKDLLFYGEYTVESDTIIDLEGYGTVKLLNIDGEIQIELIKEDNPEQKINMSVEVDKQEFSERTAFLANVWKDAADDFYVFFTKDGAIISSDGNGIWEWTDDTEETIKAKISDDIFQINLLTLTEESIDLTLSFDVEGVTYTDTINLVRADYEELMDHVGREYKKDDDEEYNVPSFIAGKGSVSIDGEELFKIVGAAGRQNEVFDNDSSGRFFDLVFMEDVKVLEKLDEYEGDEFIGNMLSVGITTSADDPKKLIGDYSSGGEWEEATSASDYGVQFAGLTTMINDEFTLYLKDHGDGLSVESFTVKEGEDRTFVIDAKFNIHKVTTDHEEVGEKATVSFHYEGKLFFITEDI
ncbi:hypothetical protein [Flammeovirga sp. EKP202]|uniref:hypothetical protein n=1 Tax=Flammeovirga sp. EKP202 TaxID=2770592 RepID=UPI00165F5A71|nr:hypothetical protein [Flammeovirga sp. EKP202]MBD0401113.1 hypothetical protein [Flammeovirga sp. EKP202]